MFMAYSGKFTPSNTKKYLGDPTNIIFRSLWERRVMVYLDTNPGVVEWSNEEIVIPYLSPVDNKYHRYFPDFFVRVRNKQGMLEGSIIEVKPAHQTEPPKKKSRITKAYLNEVMTWGVNEAKWKAATEYCKDRNWKFRIITENELFGKK
jgi:TnsA endonuclease N terminal